MAEPFPEIARRELALLLHDHGFTLVAEDQHHIRLESRSVGVEAWHDPRGEVDVRVSRLDTDDPHEAWTYTGMVGTASVSRLLQIAVEKMTANASVLRGDQAFYKQIGAENRRSSEAWTAYDAGKGPQPTGKLRSGDMPARWQSPATERPVARVLPRISGAAASIGESPIKEPRIADPHLFEQVDESEPVPL